jgi:AraC family transcriptional regulator of adaptative response/methylated-DNA-[protein]-cysteine methyltransferase
MNEKHSYDECPANNVEYSIETMVPPRFQRSKELLKIFYSYSECRYGNVLIANTEKGICFVAFSEREKRLFDELKKLFPHAECINRKNDLHEHTINLINGKKFQTERLTFHIQGSNFQIEVWKSLLEIPRGTLATYSEIAHRIGKPNSTRAVGRAIGKNPIAYFMPCHRVVQSSGSLGGYRWGTSLKEAFIEDERHSLACPKK